MVLAELGGILAIGYGIWAGRNELSAHQIDSVVKPVFDEEKDWQTVEENFESICSRSGIKLNKDGIPIKRSEHFSGANYLRKKGFGERIAKRFEEYYLDKFDSYVARKKKELGEIHNSYEASYDPNAYTDTFACIGTGTKVYKRKVNLALKEDMEKLCRASKLWNSIVYDYSIISYTWYYEEVWTLKFDWEKLAEATKETKTEGIEELYEQVCFLADVPLR